MKIITLIITTLAILTSCTKVKNQNTPKSNNTAAESIAATIDVPLPR